MTLYDEINRNMQERNSLYTYKTVDCNICGGSSLKFKCYRRNIHNLHRVKIVECKNCGLIFPNPMPVCQNISELYSDMDYFDLHPIDGKLAYYESLILRLEKILGGKGTLLDIASGRGELLIKARELGWQVTGIDISRRFCEFIRQNYEIDVINADFLSHDFSENFDILVANAVLEHVYEPLNFIKKAYRLLKTNGLFYLDLPNEASLYSLLGNLYYKLTIRNYCINLAPTFPPYHIHGFTRKTLHYIIDMIGFELIHISTIGKCYVPDNSWNLIEKAGVKAVDYLSAWLNMKPHFSVILKKR